MIQNISFIVVARNEAFGVEKCLQLLVSMPLDDCEIICVDSDSTDDTLEVMKRYATQCATIQVYQCKGYVNSAIARNVGLKHAVKEFCFFVDGDVELNEKFIHMAMEYLLSGRADMVTGQLGEIYYEPDYQNEIRRIEDRYYIREEKRTFFSGGILIARSSIVRKAGNWDERMARNQDIDFTLRLSRHGRFVAIPLSMGTHHTLEYHERTWHFLQKRFPMYFGMLIRKNLDQPKAILSLLKQNRGFVAGFIMYLLLLAGILVACVLSGSFYYVAFAFSFMVTCDLFWGAIRKKNVFNHFLTHYLYVPMIISGIFFDVNRDRPTTTAERIC
jgi:glycosyltransferase involved in cell wall biosynthesis